MRRKQYSFAQFLLYAVILAFFDEKSSQAFRGNIGFDGLRVAMFPRFGYGVFVNISSKNLNFWRVGQARGVFAKKHSQTVGFFTRSATARPNADGIAHPSPGEE